MFTGGRDGGEVCIVVCVCVSGCQGLMKCREGLLDRSERTKE